MIWGMRIKGSPAKTSHPRVTVSIPRQWSLRSNIRGIAVQVRKGGEQVGGVGTSSHTRLMGRKGCAVAERREQRAQVTHITDVCCGGASDYQHPAGGGVVCLACVVVSPLLSLSLLMFCSLSACVSVTSRFRVGLLSPTSLGLQ